MRHTIVRSLPGSLARCAAQVGLGLAGLMMAVLGIAAGTLVLPYPWAAAAMKGLANLGRRLAGAWGGVEIAIESRPGPPAPQRRADGWYAHDRQLFKSPRVPAFLLRLRWLSEDPSAQREWLWLGLTPLFGGAVTLVPPVLAGAGLALAAGALCAAAGFLPATAVPAGMGIPEAIGAALVLVVLGFVLAPATLRLHALWTRALLRPAAQSWWRTSGIGPWLGRRSMAVWHGGGLAGLSFAAFGGFLLNLAAALASWGGLVPQASGVSRRLVDLYRDKLRQWTGAEIAQPYRPYPPPPQRGADGLYRAGRSLHSDRAAAIRAQRFEWIRGDPATWRDLLWMALAPLPALVGLVPAVLVSLGFFGLTWQPVPWALWAVPLGLSTGEWVTPWYIWYAVTYVEPGLAVVPGWMSPFIGLAIAAPGVLLAVPLLRLRRRFDRLLLAPTKAATLAQRVRRLTETRADAADAEAAELRRIERDLHDGAQARLVAVGLSLATIEQLLHSDPDAARELVAQARETSATALAELRDLVRGIHPPVLAERGLVDAVRAVALDSPLPVAVTLGGGLSTPGGLDAPGGLGTPGGLDAPVESAAYFATVEALANAIRHAGATRVDVHLSYGSGVLRVTVTDDGHGGADPSRGSGLRGIRRRLATFDGVLTVRSPTGGPTVVTLEVPCALSSPRTSTS